MEEELYYSVFQNHQDRTEWNIVLGIKKASWVLYTKDKDLGLNQSQGKGTQKWFSAALKKFGNF